MFSFFTKPLFNGWFFYEYKSNIYIGLYIYGRKKIDMNLSLMKRQWKVYAVSHLLMTQIQIEALMFSNTEFIIVVYQMKK
jgi:hypothetical protein